MLEDEALEYHSLGRPGKIAIAVTKPCATQHHLALAYTPGVAEPVRRIAADPSAAFQYTARGNLVEVDACRRARRGEAGARLQRPSGIPVAEGHLDPGQVAEADPVREIRRHGAGVVADQVVDVLGLRL